MRWAMEKKANLQNLQRSENVSTPVDGIIVPMKFYCTLCKGYYKEMVDQGMLYRMPKYMTLPTGERRSVYLGDGSTIIKAHPTCAQKYANRLHQNKDKKRIITGV